tara:strand:+ start:6078 stop:6929 length:852 start_codon:yes stop_codon:yes gene_type:complete
MILWIASYPKSGNTWVRSLICSYYYTNDGVFTDDAILKNIGQFPEKKHFEKFDYNTSVPGDTIKFWIKAQDSINRDKKFRFFKTHNFLGKINNTQFTNEENTLGAIYILRDPRNVITSIKNHFEMTYEESLEFMLNERKYTYDYFKKNDYGDFQFLSSWEKNYQTWINNKMFPTLVIKYENLISQTFVEFKKIVDFIDNLMKQKKKFNDKKAINALSSTNFSNLKKVENTIGFSESLISKNNKKKIPFFHLGPKNDWKEILNKDFQNKINKIFKKNLKDLEYL